MHNNIMRLAEGRSYSTGSLHNKFKCQK